MRRLLFLFSLFALASACGIKRVPNSMLEKLPYEAKIELLESENDLAIAVDRLDEARNEVQRTVQLIRRAKDRLKEADREVGDAEDDRSREVAQLAVTEAEARVEYLRADQRTNVREADLAEKNLTCAMARYEEARLAAARKAKLEGSEELNPDDFAAQVAKCDEQYAEMKEELKEQTDEAALMRDEWDKTRAALAKKTFDARASPYVE